MWYYRGHHDEKNIKIKTTIKLGKGEIIPHFISTEA